MNTKIIDLCDYKSDQSRVYSGRARGKTVRIKLQLDILDKDDSIITFKVPPETLSINSSFFLGLFGESVRYLGATRFKEKYNFEADDIILENVKEGIERALKTKSVF